MELTPDELRLIEKRRSEKAISERPIDDRAVLKSVLNSVSALVDFGQQRLDPHDPLWDDLRSVLDRYGVLRP